MKAKLRACQQDARAAQDRATAAAASKKEQAASDQLKLQVDFLSHHRGSNCCCAGQSPVEALLYLCLPQSRTLKFSSDLVVPCLCVVASSCAILSLPVTA